MLLTAILAPIAVPTHLGGVARGDIPQCLPMQDGNGRPELLEILLPMSADDVRDRGHVPDRTTFANSSRVRAIVLAVRCV